MSNNESDKQAKKEEVGRSLGRQRRRPPPRWKLIDKVLAQPVGIKVNGTLEKGTVFEAINLMLDQEIGKGRKRALRIKRKYEAYASARPKVIVRPDLDVELLAEIYADFCRTGVIAGVKPRKPSKAELEEAKEWQNLSPEEAAEVYQASIKWEE